MKELVDLLQVSGFIKGSIESETVSTDFVGVAVGGSAVLHFAYCHKLLIAATLYQTMQPTQPI